MFEQSPSSPRYQISAKFKSFKQQVRDRQISHYKQTIRTSNTYLLINYEDAQSSILNLKRALLYCNDLEEQVIDIMSQLMDFYDFSLQISEQKLIETIIITFSSQEIREKNQQKYLELTLRWLQIIHKTIIGWPHLWRQLHNNVAPILWGLAIDLRQSPEVLGLVCKNFVCMDQNLKISTQPSLTQLQQLLKEEQNIPELIDLLAIGFNPARQCNNFYFPVAFFPNALIS